MALGLAGLLAAAAASLAWGQALRMGHAVQFPALPEAEAQAVAHTNAYRARQGLPPVAPDPTLSAAAREFAQYMAGTDAYGHHADGRELVERTQARGYMHCMVAENIAYVFSSTGFETADMAQRFVQGWIDSPLHRHNLLAPEVTDIGLAIAHSPRSGRFYAVQLLGRPASLQVRFEMVNRSPVALQYEVDGQTFSLPRGSTRWHAHCTLPRVQLQLPGHADTVALQPAHGARYRIDAAGERLRLSGS